MNGKNFYRPKSLITNRRKIKIFDDFDDRGKVNGKIYPPGNFRANYNSQRLEKGYKNIRANFASNNYLNKNGKNLPLHYQKPNNGNQRYTNTNITRKERNVLPGTSFYERSNSNISGVSTMSKVTMKSPNFRAATKRMPTQLKREHKQYLRNAYYNRQHNIKDSSKGNSFREGTSTVIDNLSQISDSMSTNSILLKGITSQQSKRFKVNTKSTKEASLVSNKGGLLRKHRIKSSKGLQRYQGSKGKQVENSFILNSTVIINCENESIKLVRISKEGKKRLFHCDKRSQSLLGVKRPVLSKQVKPIQKTYTNNGLIKNNRKLKSNNWVKKAKGSRINSKEILNNNKRRIPNNFNPNLAVQVKATNKRKATIKESQNHKNESKSVPRRIYRVNRKKDLSLEEQFLQYYNIRNILHRIDKQQKLPNSLITFWTDSSRKSIIKWMYEVNCVFSIKCCQSSIIRAVMLMDRYVSLQKNMRPFTSEIIHRIAISCLFIASKYEDMYPIMAKELKTFIIKNKYEMTSLVKLEAQILSVLDFQVSFPLPSYCIDLFLSIYCKSLGTKYLKRLRYLSYLLMKLSLMYIQFSMLKPDQLALTCIIAGINLFDVMAGEPLCNNYSQQCKKKKEGHKNSSTDFHINCGKKDHWEGWKGCSQKSIISSEMKVVHQLIYFEKAIFNQFCLSNEVTDLKKLLNANHTTLETNFLLGVKQKRFPIQLRSIGIK